MTREQWEAEKARIDEERKRLYERLLPYVGMLTASNVSIEHFPYPTKPEKTVTLRDEQVVRYNRLTGGYQQRLGDEWSVMNPLVYATPSNVRLLASLLPENQET